MDKQYNFKENEEKLYKEWAKKDVWKPKGEGKPFVMVIPPPNVTGSLHMGHALNTTCQDILARYYRQKGRPVKWVVGTDHAGIATQTKVEKALLKKGIKKNEISKEEFLKHIWLWKEEYGNQIIHQLQRLGASCDWSKIYFTMDNDYQEAVKTAFKHFYDQGLIYQADRVVNWCTRCQTSLSDLEVEYRKENTKLYYFKYDKDFPIVIATTRPETKLGDSAVAVNPKDKRYKKYIGQTISADFVGQKLNLKIIADPMVDMKFGTGALGVTPAHSLADAELAEKYSLKSIQVIDRFGKIVSNFSEGLKVRKFKGLRAIEAREKIIEELEKKGLIEKIEDIKHNISICYRCEREIEPMTSKQWFVSMKPETRNPKSETISKSKIQNKSLRELGMEAVKSGKVQFVPKKWEKVYLNWMENVKDWCISRQLVWGHRMPVFIKKQATNLKFKIKNLKLNDKDIYVGDNPPEGFEQVDDVLDTWFSSALWSFATLGYPKKLDKKYYPTTVLSTARDIIHLWVSRMIFSSLDLTGEIPFEKVYIHPTIYNQEGKRMSKSLGTGLDPIELIDKYGADAVRFGLTLLNTGVQDIKFSEVHILAGRKFANKLWNIARFIEMNEMNRKFLISNFQFSLNFQNPIYNLYFNKVDKLETETERDLEQFRFGQALERIYHFIWHDFADKMIEETKQDESDEKMVFLQTVFSRLLNLVEPFMPFVASKLKSEIRIPKF